MKVTSYLFTIFFLAIGLNCMAQLSPVPKSYSLTTPEDYNKYEKDVINVINWLEQTPWNSNNGERQIANSFFLAWMSGSPTVTVELSDEILMQIMEKNKELLFAYMGGYTKYTLQTRADKTNFDVNKAKLAGFKAVISKYNTEKKRSKDMNVEMLAKLDSEGKLENWVVTELSKKINFTNLIIMNAFNYPPSPMSVDERIIRPSKSFKKSIAGVITSMVLFLAAYILLFAAAVALVFLIAFIGITLVDAIHNFWVAVISIGLVLSSIMLLYFLIKFIFKKPERDYSTMLEITDDEQPRLFQFLRQLTDETKSPFPKKVYISADVNASVFYDPSFWNLFFPAKKNLNIGLGLVNTLNTSEFKAVIAHEFGHFSQRSMKLGVYVYNMHHAIHNLVYDNEKYEDTMKVVGNLHWSLKIGISMNLFLVKQIQNALASVYRYVNKRYMQLSREMEFNADAIAAFVAGSNHMIKCLRRMEIAAFCFDQMFIFLQTLNGQKKRPANVYPHHQAAIRFFAETRQLPADERGIPICDESTVVFNKTRINIEDQWASHPALTQREDKLHNIDLPVSTTNIPAWSIFDEPEKLQIAITNIIYSNTPDRPEAVSDEIINEAYISYNNEQSLNTFYKSYYDGRLITAFNVDKSLQKKWPHMTAESVFTSEKYNLPLTINALTTDINLLDYITAGKEIETFDFDGVKYDKSQAAEIQLQLLKELEDAENDLKKIDEEIFHYFYQNSTNSDAIISEYKFYFDEQEKAVAYLDSYTNMMAAVNPMFSTMRFEAIEEAMTALYGLEQKFKPRVQEILDNEQYASVIDAEQAKHMRMYLSNDWKYFVHPQYDEPSILVLTQALSAFYDVVRDRLFTCKKQLTDTQLSLLN